MTCIRCQGLVIDDAGIMRCLNCGYRPCVTYSPPPIERMNADREAAAYKKVEWLEIRRLARENARPRGKDKQKRKRGARV